MIDPALVTNFSIRDNINAVHIAAHTESVTYRLLQIWTASCIRDNW